MMTEESRKPKAESPKWGTDRAEAPVAKTPKSQNGQGAEGQAAFSERQWTSPLAVIGTGESV